MNFTSYLPYWNSLDAVRRIHSSFEFASIVLFALLALFDILAHLAKTKEKEILLERIGLVFFALAVVAELIAYPYGQRNDALSEQLIGSLDRKAQNAAEKAAKAVIDSGDAVTKASAATSSADTALSEANSFELDIVSAKKQAAEAESHLADALQRAAKAEKEIASSQLELSRLTGPPYLVPIIHGTATPDLSFGIVQQIVLTENVKINAPRLPSMPRGGSITWSLLIDQDSTGNHDPIILFSPSLPNKLFWSPNTRSTFEYITDDKGRTTERSLPMLMRPIENSPTQK